ncbi:VENN motif pre-toxin domain-containing protein, partial [Salinicola socius]
MLVEQLATLVDNDSQLLTAASQITGVIAAGLADGDVQQGAEIAGNATAYNYLSHWQEAKKDEELAACKDDLLCKAGTRANWAMVDAQQEAGLLIGSAGGIALSAKEAAEGVYALVTNFPEVMDGLKQLATSPEFRQQFGENYLNDLQVRADRLAEAYETAGWDGSITAGVEGGRFAAELVGVLTAVKGGAQLIAKL